MEFTMHAVRISIRFASLLSAAFLIVDGAPVWTMPARAEARRPIAAALAEVLERVGADSAAVRYRELQHTAKTAYRFGKGSLFPGTSHPTSSHTAAKR